MSAYHLKRVIRCRLDHLQVSDTMLCIMTNKRVHCMLITGLNYIFPCCNFFYSSSLPCRYVCLFDPPFGSCFHEGDCLLLIWGALKKLVIFYLNRIYLKKLRRLCWPANRWWSTILLVEICNIPITGPVITDFKNPRQDFKYHEMLNNKLTGICKISLGLL